MMLDTLLKMKGAKDLCFFSSPLFLCLVLSACSGPKAEPDGPAALMDRDAARQKLQQRKQSAAQQAQWAAEQKRIADEKIAASELAKAEEASKPHYDPQRIAQAARIRQWQNITVPDLNINCWLKSNWKDGKINFRLALLGDKTALRIFRGDWPYFKVIFTDGIGNNLQQAVVRSEDLHWADSLKNSGSPTLEFESSTEMPLEVYESSTSWNLKWDQQPD